MRKLMLVLLTLGMLAAFQLPAHAVDPNYVILTCPAPNVYTGCHGANGVAAQVKVQDISNMGCNQQHIESVYLTKLPPETWGPEYGSVELGWEVDRTNCQSSSKYFFAAYYGTTGPQHQYPGPDGSLNAFYRLTITPYSTGRFRAYVNTVPGGSTVWSIIIPPLDQSALSWSNGKAVTAFESDDEAGIQTCSSEAAYNHANVDFRSPSVGGWVHANPDNNAQLHIQLDTCTEWNAGLADSRGYGVLPDGIGDTVQYDPA